MGIPLTLQEAEKAGLKKVAAADLANAKSSSGAITFDSPTVNYICYVGPCSGGVRTICYHTDFGCNACYYTSEGC